MSYHHHNQHQSKNTKHLSAPSISKPVTPKHFSTSDVFKNQDQLYHNHHKHQQHQHQQHQQHYENTATASKSMMSKPQVYMQGERVILAESASAPGIPIIYRLEEERKSNPDKLNLDRRKLCVCPLLEGEENLRLLNLQHNLITRIQHMHVLRKLIFLDLYDNHIEEISGLTSLKCLRVLMLGKNRIRKITNLQDMTLLDVLDLHGNKISKIENLSTLNQLRVLNLAGNELTEVKNLNGLTSLSELNLRRNSIKTVVGLDTLSALQRIFLSYNNIESFDDIHCLANAPSLVDLALDNNPLANQNHYKQCILQSVTTLKQLDMKRLTEEEKRIAQVIARKEEEKRKENERLISIKERRRVAISNAKRQWDRQFTRAERNSSMKEYNNRSSAASPITIASSTSSPSCHLAELDNNTLSLYGPRSLDALDKTWGDKGGTNCTVECISFKFINFQEIVQRLKTLNERFTTVQTLRFEATNITLLNEINSLSRLRHLTDLVIGEGNPVTSLKFWKDYVIFKLRGGSETQSETASPSKLKTINGEQITLKDIESSESIFKMLGHTLQHSLPSYMTICLEGDDDPLSILTQHKDTDNGDGQKSPGEDDHDTFSKNYIREVIQDAIVVTRKLNHFERLWPHMIRDMVSKYVDEMSGDVEAYCKKSLDKIRAS